MINRWPVIACIPVLAAIVTLGCLTAASALSYTFTTIDVPGSLRGTTGDIDLGIHDLGQIVGDFTDSAGTRLP